MHSRHFERRHFSNYPKLYTMLICSVRAGVTYLSSESATKHIDYCPFDITRKAAFFFFFFFFLLGVLILNENIFADQKPFVFSISVFCCQLFTLKLNLSDIYNFYSEVMFLNVLSKKLLLLFALNLNY